MELKLSEAMAQRHSEVDKLMMFILVMEREIMEIAIENGHRNSGLSH
jgi:hypothetical protein